MRLYIASSWRNPIYPEVLAALRAAGHDCYDFKEHGFGWREIDGDWQNWTPEQFRANLRHARAIEGYKRDMGALNSAEAVVLVLPCGRSAHLEAGYAVGSMLPLHVLLQPGCEPELMYKMASHLCLTIKELVESLRSKPAVDCDLHGVVELWSCPRCGRDAAWAGVGEEFA